PGMAPQTTLLLVEDDPQHAFLILANLEEEGLREQVRHFGDGQKVLDFLFDGPGASGHEHYVMLLDVQMPRVDGIAVLEKSKHDCNASVQKSIAYREFADTVRCIAGSVKHLSLPSLHAVPGRLHECIRPDRQPPRAGWNPGGVSYRR